jgi:co-chaperonin GroES (HSP10)
MLEGSRRTEIHLEPLEDHLVVEPLDDSETASGLIVPLNEAAQTRTGIVVSVGPDVNGVEPGDKILYAREAGYDVRLARSPLRVRVLKREDVIAKVHD